jgi:hypothetical protein
MSNKIENHAKQKGHEFQLIINIFFEEEEENVSVFLLFRECPMMKINFMKCH